LSIVSALANIFVPGFVAARVPQMGCENAVLVMAWGIYGLWFCS
jgi:hypothetical protein